MRARTMLIWFCGDGGDDYKLQTDFDNRPKKGFRSISGSIAAPAGRLHIVSYSALTMAAQFADSALPSREEANFVVECKPGIYAVDIVQTYDPDSGGPPFGKPHFYLDLRMTDAHLQAWESPAWEM